MERTCKRCGVPLPPKSPANRLYCKECATQKRHETSAAWAKANPDKCKASRAKAKRKKEKEKEAEEQALDPMAGMSLDEIALAASEAGMSYGQYVAMHKI